MHHHLFHLHSTQDWILNHGIREDIIEWLVWNDRNGTYTDADCEVEDIDKLTLEEARKLMRGMVSSQTPLDLN